MTINQTNKKRNTVALKSMANFLGWADIKNFGKLPPPFGLISYK